MILAEMNFYRRVISYISLIIAVYSIHSTSAQYEPIYFFDSNTDSHLVYNVKPDLSSTTNQRFKLEDPLLYISVACPPQANADLLEVLASDHSVVIQPICKEIVESRIRLAQKPAEELNAVAFSVKIDHDLDGAVTRTDLKLIQFKFDFTLHRIKFLTYFIGSGKLLNVELTNDQQEVADYQKNIDMFEYDLDNLYSQTVYPLSKVRLAPVEDFFFDNWKSASLHNVLTAPMWRELLPHWRALEMFVRKVTRVIDFALVTTGIHDTLTLPGSNSQTGQKLYLYNGKHPVPKYFWKAIYYTVELGDQVYTAGILFVMHNFNPNTPINESDNRKICPSQDVSTAGWNFAHGTEFKGQMYACLYNEENMKIFNEKPIEDSELFDLKKVFILETDAEGRKTMNEINVLDKIREMEN